MIIRLGVVCLPPAQRSSYSAGLIESDATTRCPALVSIPKPLPLKPGALPTELPGALSPLL